jgi:hypothetical protein
MNPGIIYIEHVSNLGLYAAVLCWALAFALAALIYAAVRTNFTKES